MTRGPFAGSGLTWDDFLGHLDRFNEYVDEVEALRLDLAIELLPVSLMAANDVADRLITRRAKKQYRKRREAYVDAYLGETA